MQCHSMDNFIILNLTILNWYIYSSMEPNVALKSFSINLARILQTRDKCHKCRNLFILGSLKFQIVLTAYWSN